MMNSVWFVMESLRLENIFKNIKSNCPAIKSNDILH